MIKITKLKLFTLIIIRKRIYHTLKDFISQSYSLLNRTEKISKPEPRLRRGDYWILG